MVGYADSWGLGEKRRKSRGVVDLFSPNPKFHFPL
jgi:hypothetical protein